MSIWYSYCDINIIVETNSTLSSLGTLTPLIRFHGTETDVNSTRDTMSLCN